MPVILDLTHTTHSPALTGIQRVCRELFAHLGAAKCPPHALVYDRYARQWREPDAVEQARLAPDTVRAGYGRRPARWSFAQKSRGRLGWVTPPDWEKWRGAPLLAPEIFDARVFPAYAGLRAKLGGAAGAIFYDAVALRLPEFSPAATVSRFPAYLRELAAFDGVAAISEASRAELFEHWARLQIASPPPVTAIPLGVEPPGAPGPTASADAMDADPLVLSLGTFEGRKNQISLLEAAETLWREGQRFRLTLAGMHEASTGGAAVKRARELRAAGRPLELPGVVDDARLEELYASCRFTVYPSLHEGFGLPVAESLLRHRPCICGSGGGLAEVARGGGCLQVPEPTPAYLAEAMRTLLNDRSVHDRLIHEAAQRRFSTWADYARQIAAWLADLRPRCPEPVTA